MRDLYTDRHDHLAAYVRAGPCPPDTVGVIVGYGGQIVALELFDAPDMLQTCWPRLIHAAALDALAHDPGVAIPLPRAVRTLHRPQQAACQRFPSPGVGDDLRLAGEGAAGAALLHDGVVVHAVLHRVAEQA